MQFLLSTNLLASNTVEDMFRLSHRGGFDGVEIWMEHIVRDRPSVSSLKALKSSLDLHVTIHAPSRDINITSSNAGIRRESLDQTKEAFELASVIGAPVVTVHPGKMSSSRGDPEDYFALQVEALGQISLWAERAGTVAGIEIMESRPFEIVTTASDINTLLHQIDSYSIGSTFDVAHALNYCMSICGASLNSDSLKECVIKEFEATASIVHLHVSNSDPDHVHLPPARGNPSLLDLLKVFCRKYDGLAAVEGYVRSEESDVFRENCVLISEWKRILNS